MRYRQIVAEEAPRPSRLYHGTCDSHLASILRHGLQAAATKPKGGSVRHGVYLSDDLEIAAEYAWLGCDLKHNARHDPVVIVIDAGVLDPALLQPDDYDLQDQVQGGEISGSEPIDPRLQRYQRWDEVPWPLSLAITNQVFYAGDIPASALTVVSDRGRAEVNQHRK